MRDAIQAADSQVREAFTHHPKTGLSLRNVVDGKHTSEIREQLQLLDGGFTVIATYIQEVTGRRLPQELIDQLSFGDLQWQMLKLPLSQSLLFIGDDQSQAYPDQASGTIMVQFGASLDEPQPRAYLVNLAGVLKDNQPVNRVAAVTYDLTYPELSPLTRADISFADREFSAPQRKKGEDKFEWEVRRQEWANNVVPIPTMKNSFPENTAGLITPAMVALIGGHQHALRLYSSRSEGGNFGFPDNEYAASKGFKCRLESGDYVVSLKNNWQVRLAANLQ